MGASHHCVHQSKTLGHQNHSRGTVQYNIVNIYKKSLISG
jgi:hypothetical protein